MTATSAPDDGVRPTRGARADGELVCPRCGVQQLEPAGERRKPYWWCPDCGVVRDLGR